MSDIIMKPHLITRLVLAAALIALFAVAMLLGAYGCGKKAPPRPPDEAVFFKHPGR